MKYQILRVLLGICITALPLATFGAECSQGLSEIRLEVTSTDILYSPLNGGIGAFSTQVVDRKRNDLEVYPVAVRDAYQLRQVIEGLKNNCRRIKELSILAHGDSGFIAFPENSLEASNLVAIFSDLEEAFTESPRIKISGCNVAKGCLGRAFILALAKMLIRKNGLVIGSTQFEVSWFRLAPFVPLNLFRQKLTFDSIQKKYQFSSGTASCRVEMDNKIKKLNTFLEKQLSDSEKKTILDSIAFIRKSGQELQTMSEDIFRLSQQDLQIFLKKAYDSEEKFQILLETYGSDRDKLANKLRMYSL